jgi:Carboxypeptidase regulatory-like domain
MYFTRVVRSTVAALFLTILLVPAVLAQVETGTITGTVRDPSNAVVPNAQISLRNLGTGATRTVHSGNLGQFNVTGLPVGTYEVTVTSGNFATYKTNAEVTVGGIVSIDIPLSTGQATCRHTTNE